MSSNKYRSDISKSVHVGVARLHELGIVDKTTMRRFDASCLTATPQITPTDVRELRERENASQAVLAAHLGVSPATVGQWERGQRKIEGPALKLLTLVKVKGLSYIR
jgi:putative transcriptional regulator